MSEPTTEGLDAQDVALLAHEIRGALTVINGFSEVMRRPLTDAAREQALQGISRAVRRIDDLLGSALSGAFETKATEIVRLGELVESVADEQRAVSGRSIEVRVEDDAEVEGFSAALERAVSNLVENALKYSLYSSPVELSVRRSEGEAVVCVADRGPGIPRKDRERAMQPFERLSPGDDVPGSGLGLAVVRSVAEAHGGRVEIGDRAGGGSLICLYMPRA